MRVWSKIGLRYLHAKKTFQLLNLVQRGYSVQQQFFITSVTTWPPLSRHAATRGNHNF